MNRTRISNLAAKRTTSKTAKRVSQHGGGLFGKIMSAVKRNPKLTNTVKGAVTGVATDMANQQIASVLPVAIAPASPAVVASQPAAPAIPAEIMQMVASYKAMQQTVKQLEQRIRILENPSNKMVNQLGQVSTKLQQIGQATPNPAALQQAGTMVNAAVQSVAAASPISLPTSNQLGGGSAQDQLLTAKEYAHRLIQVVSQFDQIKPDYPASLHQINQLAKAIEIERSRRDLSKPIASRSFIRDLLHCRSSNSQAQSVLQRIRMKSSSIDKTHRQGSGPSVPVLIPRW